MENAALYFEIAGEGSMGKTYSCCTSFSRPFLLDTTPRGDGRFTARKVFGDDFGDKYYRARSLDDAVDKVDDVIKSGEFATVAIDEYSGMRKLGSKWYMKTFKKNAVFPISDWSIITNRINNEIIWKLQDSDINVVVTSGFHDVYIKGERTGGRAANSPPNASLDIDFRIMLVENEEHTDVNVRVVKNKFMSIRERNQTMKFPLTWNEIKKECVFVGFEYCE